MGKQSKKQQQLRLSRNRRRWLKRNLHREPIAVDIECNGFVAYDEMAPVDWDLLALHFRDCRGFGANALDLVKVSGDGEEACWALPRADRSDD